MKKLLVCGVLAILLALVMATITVVTQEESAENLVQTRTSVEQSAAAPQVSTNENETSKKGQKSKTLSFTASFE
jgi:hypothetical protein